MLRLHRQTGGIGAGQSASATSPESDPAIAKTSDPTQGASPPTAPPTSQLPAPTKTAPMPLAHGLLELSVHPPAVRASLLGASAGGPWIITRWGRDELMRDANPRVMQAMLERVGSAKMNAPEDVVAAFDDLIRGRDGPKVKEHEKALRSMAAYCDRIGNADDPTLNHFNTYDVPGIASIPGVELYSLRAFGMVRGPKDLIVVPETAPEHLLAHHREIRRLSGLSSGEEIKLGDYRAHRQELDRLYRLAEFYRTVDSPNPRLYAFQEYFENKNNSIRFLVANSIDVPKLWHMGLVSNVSTWRIEDYPVVLKQVRSAGGAGVHICGTHRELIDVLGALDPAEEIQIQAMVPGIDCSKQYYISDHGMVPISNTDQLIENGVAHAGNLVLSDALSSEDNRMADRAARAVFQAGYRGYFAVDMIKPVDGSRAKVIELNLRKGGVTAPSTVAAHLGAGEFSTQQVKFPSIDSAIEAAQVFAPKRGKGMVVYSLIPLDSGEVKAGVVCLSSRGGRDVLEDLSNKMDQEAKA